MFIAGGDFRCILALKERSFLVISESRHHPSQCVRLCFVNRKSGKRRGEALSPFSLRMFASRVLLRVPAAKAKAVAAGFLAFPLLSPLS